MKKNIFLLAQGLLLVLISTSSFALSESAVVKYSATTEAKENIYLHCLAKQLSEKVLVVDADTDYSDTDGVEGMGLYGRIISVYLTARSIDPYHNKRMKFGLYMSSRNSIMLYQNDVIDRDFREITETHFIDMIAGKSIFLPMSVREHPIDKSQVFSITIECKLSSLSR